jgi:hypothetical protein
LDRQGGGGKRKRRVRALPEMRKGQWLDGHSFLTRSLPPVLTHVPFPLRPSLPSGPPSPPALPPYTRGLFQGSLRRSRHVSSADDAKIGIPTFRRSPRFCLVRRGAPAEKLDAAGEGEEGGTLLSPES